VNPGEWPHSAYDLSAMAKDVRHLLQTILAVARALASLAPSAMRSRAQLAAENLFLRKQLALYQERKVRARRADDATRIIPRRPVAFPCLASIAGHREAGNVDPLASAGVPIVLALEVTYDRPACDFTGRAAADRDGGGGESDLGRGTHRKRAPAEAGHPVVAATVRRYMPQRPRRPKPGTQAWRTFVRNHARSVLASDFFVVVTATFRVLYVFVVLEVGTRRNVHWNATAHPTADWTAQQFRMIVRGDQAYRFVIHDRDTIYSEGVDRTLDAMGLTVLKTPARAPQANAFCERVIGTIRRECLDFMIPMSERHLRAILGEWVDHYNRGRPHASLGPGIPEGVNRRWAPQRVRRPFGFSKLPSRGHANSERSPSRIPARSTRGVNCASVIFADHTTQLTPHQPVLFNEARDSRALPRVQPAGQRTQDDLQRSEVKHEAQLISRRA
jgi:transposase InsO family protein